MIELIGPLGSLDNKSLGSSLRPWWKTGAGGQNEVHLVKVRNRGFHYSRVLLIEVIG